MSDRQKARELYEKATSMKNADPAGAYAVMLQAAEADEEFADAAKELGPMAFSLGKPIEARRHLAASLPLYDADDEAQSLALAEVYFLLGTVCENLGDGGAALENYSRSYDLNSGRRGLLEALARCAKREGAWEKTLKYNQIILARLRETKTPDELAELFAGIGEAYGKLGNDDKAVSSIEKALEINPKSVAALTAAAEYYEGAQNWQKAIKYRVMLSSALPKAESAKQWIIIGEIYRGKMKRTNDAYEAYKHALSIHADDPELLKKTAETVVELGKYANAIFVYKKLLATAENLAQKREYSLKIAEVYSELSNDPAGAMPYFNSALDISPDDEEVFKKAEKALSEKGLHEELDVFYRGHLARFKEDSSAKKRAELLKKLAKLLDEKLGKAGEAAKARELAAGLERKDDGGGTRYAAIAENVFNASAHQALFDERLEAGDIDGAFRAACVLNYLKAGDAQAKEFYQRHSQSRRTEPKDNLDRKEYYSFVMPPECQNFAGQIFSILYHHVPSLATRDRSGCGANKRNKIELTDGLSICNLFNQTIGMAAAPEPEVYASSSLAHRAETAPVYPPTVLIPEDMFARQSEADALFHIGRAVALARPDFVFALMYGAKELAEILHAAISLFNESFRSSADADAADRIKRQIAKETPDKRKPELERFVGEYLAAQTPFNAAAWIKGVEKTANRTGLLACNSLSTALKWAETYETDKPVATTESVNAAKRDLMLFWLSEGCGLLRKTKLGFEAR